MDNKTNSQLSVKQMLTIIRNGLRPSQYPKHIIVIGAGLAGLVAASLLKNSGNKVIILEANDRIGGRAYTIRSLFNDKLYFNVGPMRIPDTHDLTLEYLEKFKLPTNLFINQTSKDIICANGIKTRFEKFERDPNILKYPVAPNEEGKTAEKLMNRALQPIINFIKQDPKRNWDIVESKYSKHSFWLFLKSYFSDSAIDMIGILLDKEAFMGISLVEILRGMENTSTTQFYEITGGMDRLPNAFLPQLKEDVLLHHKIIKIFQDQNSVTIYGMHEQTSEHFTVTGDLAIVTLPFTALRFVKLAPYESFSYYKRRAIRELNYMASTKIAIEFKSRFWEKVGQRGGRSITDLPIRFTYYPSYGIGTKGHSMLLASYTWADEALLWDSLYEQERIQIALSNLAEIYGNQVYSQFISGFSFSWNQNPYSCGGFANFEPGQELALAPYTTTPEGRVHFAGEHTTKVHGWMQGAIESGIRVAYEVNNLTQLC
ncbi:flavin monoamine oxidase family protein [Paenibacillus larvae]|uniref:flavin monoamine oxidase family protein n=1 Tax=Paenibacillus larvae TaxID=1464 RepID=UPI00227DDC63|nr:flavin monoamine oxidase family protein [Paenibacillus larvae]MCY9510665.1 flavin monoamine oxidase family protein [Paenibacillus larvae]MCY9527649.1 flavin monoamine oxidase family protein [Paenibacillus larvae]